MTLFTGLSAFPLTPLRQDRIDQPAYAGLIARLREADVDSITALGSTGSYAYLSRDERRTATKIAVEEAGSTPVFVGIGALRTSHVQALADDAQQAGVSGVLLAPMTYQTLTEDDVFGLYEDIVKDLTVPLIVYVNPGTTHVTFTHDLYARIAQLPNVASIKIPGVPLDHSSAVAHVAAIREILPAHVAIGVSGDAMAATGLNAGCDAWYSVIGGILPEIAVAMTRAAQAEQSAHVMAASHRLNPLWDLFTEFGGSLRVTAAIAEHLGLVSANCLPRPIHGLDGVQRARVAEVIDGILDAHPSTLSAPPKVVGCPRFHGSAT